MIDAGPHPQVTFIASNVEVPVLVLGRGSLKGGVGGKRGEEKGGQAGP